MVCVVRLRVSAMGERIHSFISLERFISFFQFLGSTNFSSMVFTMVVLLEAIIGFWLLAKKSYYGDSGEKVSLAKSSSHKQTSTNPRHDKVFFQETSNGDEGDIEVYQPCSGTEDVVPIETMSY